MEFVSTAHAAASPGSTSMDSAPTSKGSAPPAPLERAASSLGMLMKRTETAEHPCIPMFFFTLDGDVPLDAFRQRIGATLGQFERFRSFLRDGRFVDQKKFAVEDHVHEATADSFGGPPTEASLAPYLETRFVTPLASDKPQWEMVLVRHYRPGVGNSGAAEPAAPPQTLVIARVHHVIVDGTAGVRILGTMSDEARRGDLFGPEAQRQADAEVAKVMQRVQPRCGVLGLAYGVVGVLCKYAATMARPEPPTPFRGATTLARSIAWTTMDAAASMTTAKAFGCTLNDLWMCVLASARRPA